MKNCEHKNIDAGAYGTSYCLDCAEPMVARATPSRGKYWSALEDARPLRWYELAKGGIVIETGRVYIGARWDDKAGVWRLGRVCFCEDCAQWEVAQELSLHQCAHDEAWITHIAEDVIGTPTRKTLEPAPVTVGLANPHNVR